MQVIGLADFVSEVEELPLSQWLILPGLSGASLFNGKRPNTKVLALRCDLPVLCRSRGHAGGAVGKSVRSCTM